MSFNDPVGLINPSDGFVRDAHVSEAEKHINASALHVVQVAYFPSAMAARERGRTGGRATGGGRSRGMAEYCEDGASE